MKKSARELCSKIAAMPAIIVAMAACEMTVDVSQDEMSGEKIQVTVSVPVSATKVTEAVGENAVNDLQVLVFRKDGALDAYSSADIGILTVECTAGERIFVAAVNAPDLSHISSLSQFTEARSDLSDNAVADLVMAGSVSATVDEAEVSVTVEVSRLVARVAVLKITNAMSAPAYSSIPIVLRGMYLSNVAGDCPYLHADAPTLWYNKVGIRSGCPELLYSGSVSYSLEQGASHTEPNYFYCYQNSTEYDSQSGIWSPRYTRLVLETQIDGKFYYYPVSLPGIERNHTYDIEEIRLTRLGSDAPDKLVDTGAVEVRIRIVDWQDGSTVNVTI